MEMRLTPKQREVMRWLLEGGRGTPGPGTFVEVNGRRLCCVPTMEALARKALVARDAATGTWTATEAGKALWRTWHGAEVRHHDANLVRAAAWNETAQGKPLAQHSHLRDSPRS